MKRASDKPVTNADVVRRLRGIRWLVLFTIFATGVAVATQYAVSKEARSHNCATTRAAFHDFAEELGASFHLAPDDPQVIDLQERADHRLKECH